MLASQITRRSLLVTGICLALATGRAGAQAGLAAWLAESGRIGDGVVALAAAFEKFVAIGYRLGDTVARRKEDDELRAIYDDLRALFLSQSALLDRWPVLNRTPDAAAWAALQAEMLAVRSRVTALSARLADYSGRYAYDEAASLLRLQRIGAQRGFALGAAATAPLPTNPAAFASINRVRARYAALVQELYRLTLAMAKYLALPSR